MPAAAASASSVQVLSARLLLRHPNQHVCALQVGFIADLNNVPGHDVVEKVRHTVRDLHHSRRSSTMACTAHVCHSVLLIILRYADVKGRSRRGSALSPAAVISLAVAHGAGMHGAPGRLLRGQRLWRRRGAAHKRAVGAVQARPAGPQGGSHRVRPRARTLPLS